MFRNVAQQPDALKNNPFRFVGAGFACPKCEMICLLFEPHAQLLQKMRKTSTPVCKMHRFETFSA
jgi:hypothetical protein